MDRNGVPAAPSGNTNSGVLDTSEVEVAGAGGGISRVPMEADSGSETGTADEVDAAASEDDSATAGDDEAEEVRIRTKRREAAHNDGDDEEKRAAVTGTTACPAPKRRHWAENAIATISRSCCSLFRTLQQCRNRSKTHIQLTVFCSFANAAPRIYDVIEVLEF